MFVVIPAMPAGSCAGLADRSRNSPVNAVFGFWMSRLQMPLMYRKSPPAPSARLISLLFSVFWVQNWTLEMASCQ
jgi:hypothetical protein